MIYFLDNDLQLQKIVTSKNIYETNHEHELNGYIIADVLLPLDYVKKFIDKVEYFGYYYRGTFYLHKIQSTEDLHQDDVCLISGRHIFFDDMLYGKLIEDVRPQNRNAQDILNSTIAMNSRWRPQLVDTTGTLSTNFYWQPMFDVIEFVNKEFRLDFLPKVLFDGQKINGFDIEFAEKIGNDTAIRIPFGYRTLELTHEVDYSEIVTKLVVHGKGEEVGDGYGRRINIADIEFSRNGVKSPKGSIYLEDESLTATYGNDGQTPREGREVFEDIESPSELAEAGYNLYQELSRPRMAFEAKVADIGDVGIGDSVMIIRREHDLYFKARIHKVKVDLLNPDDAEVELGDYEFFKETKAERRSRKDDEAYKRRSTSMIEQLKRQFDKDFNDRVNQFREEFNQAKIDILAEVEADRERMEAEFNNTLDVWTNEFNQDVENAMKYAEEQAKAHADVVEGKLDEVTVNHKGMLDELKADVMDIDDFLGDSRALTLDERFNEATQLMEDRIRNINVNSYNMLQGTRFDESSKVDVQRISGAQILTTQHINRIRLTNDGKGFTTFEFTEPIKIEANTNYYLTVDYLTDTTPELDYLAVETPSGWTILNNADTGTEGFMNLKSDGKWNKTTIRINTPTVIEGKLRMGTRWNRGEAGTWIDVRQPYLTNTSNREWLPHPNDATQSIEMVTRRMTELEDGLSDYITRSEFNFDTGNLEQYIKSVEENVEGNKQILQKVENWQSTNGASIEETVYGFNQKVWLNDFSEINANLVPQSSSAWEQGSFWSSGGEATDSTTRMNLRTKEVIPLQLGERYTISDYSTYPSNVEKIGIHQWDANGKYVGLSWLARGASTRFTAIGTQLRLALHARDGFTVLPEFVDEPDKRIQIKLEHGSETTPMLNALSRIEQLADSVSIKVQELDGEYLTESDIQVKAGYVQLGSKQLGDEQFASIFRVSPKSIDAIADNLNLSGNLNVKGQIEAMALNAINVNAGTVRSYILESNVITGDHLAVGTTMVDKLFATSGRIDQLITKSHFVSNMKALSIEAVEGNFSSLITKYFSANYIDVDWINGKNAWFESMYTSNAMIRKLTAQTVFVRDVQAIEITANQLNLDTLRNRFNQIEGGLHITRAKDGVRWIENGVPRGNVPVQTYDSYAGSNIRFNGLNYITDNSHWQTFKYFYTPHEGRILRVVWAVGLLGSSGSASEYVEVQVDGFGNNNQINNGAGSSSRRVFVSRGNTVNITQDIPLPPPNYNMMQAYLQVRRSPSGTGVTNDVFARILHIGQYG